LTPTSDFAAMVATSTEKAGTLYGAGGTVEKAVKAAWKAVGF